MHWLTNTILLRSLDPYAHGFDTGIDQEMIGVLVPGHLAVVVHNTIAELINEKCRKPGTPDKRPICQQIEVRNLYHIRSLFLTI